MTAARLVRHPHVLWRRSLDAVLLLPLAGGGPVTLTGADAAVWYVLVEPRTVDEVVELLGGDDDDPVDLAAGVGRLVARLVARGALLTDDPAPGGPS